MRGTFDVTLNEQIDILVGKPGWDNVEGGDLGGGGGGGTFVVGYPSGNYFTTFFFFVSGKLEVFL